MSISLLVTGIACLIVLIGVISYTVFDLQPVSSQAVSSHSQPVSSHSQPPATQLGAIQ